MDIKAHKTEDGWIILKGKTPVAIGGVSTWATQAELDAVLRPKGLIFDRKSREIRKPKAAGRPRTYTPEEARARRAQRAAKARRARVERDPEAVAEEGRAWRAANKDKQKEYHKRSSQRRRERLATDPVYREQYLTYHREYQRKKREANEG